MKKWLQSPWFWPVVGVIILLILTRGQALAALGPMSKFLIPVAGGYFLYRYIKHRIKKSLVGNLSKTMAQFAEAQRQAQEQMQRHQGHPNMGSGRAAATNETVIEICPKCGEPKKAACPDCQ